MTYIQIPFTFQGNCSTSNIEITEIPVTPFPSNQFPTSRSGLTLTPIRTPNETLTSESIKEKNERDTSRYKSTQHTVSSIGQSVATKRKSIFDKSSDDTSSTSSKYLLYLNIYLNIIISLLVSNFNIVISAKQSPSAEKKPCFKPSLLGSPFYPGRTMYGGAASSYINQPNIQQQTVALVNEAKGNDETAMSSSARRIMDLLESYSSPLMEARRIPAYTKPKNDTINTSTDRFAPYTNRSLSK